MICEHCRKQFLDEDDCGVYDVNPKLNGSELDDIVICLCSSCKRKFEETTFKSVMKFIKFNNERD